MDEADIDAIWAIHKEQGVKRFIAAPWPVNLLFDEAPWGENFEPLL